LLFRFLIIVFIFIHLNLVASQKESCFSVELLSTVKNSQITMQDYPSSCLKMDIGNFNVVRCGCYAEYAEAENLLKSYSSEFSKAHLVKTYKYRFQSLEPKTVEPKIETQVNLINFKNEINIFNNSYDFFDINITQQEEVTLLDSIKSNLISNKDAQLSKFDNSLSLYGLAIDGKYDQYLKSTFLNREYTDYEYNLKLKYDFFKNGYLEKRKSNKENKNKIKVTFYQYSSEIEKYSYEEKLSNIETLLPLINFHYYQLLQKITAENLQKNKILHDLGSIAEYQIQLKEKILNKYKKNTQKYKSAIDIKIAKPYFLLLKNIELSELKNINEIQHYMKNNNSKILLQKSMYNSQDNTNSYFDKVKVNIYLSNRTVDETGWYNTVGVDSHFPLDFSSSQENEVQKLKQNAIKNHKEALVSFLNNTLDKLFREFKNSKYQIQNNKDELEILNYKLQRYELLEKDNISSLNLNIQEKIYLLQENILKLKYNISLSKLELLKILIHIKYLTNISDLNLIIKANKCL